MSTAPNLEFAFDFSEFNNDMAAVARQKELEQQAEVARRVNAINARDRSQAMSALPSQEADSLAMHSAVVEAYSRAHHIGPGKQQQTSRKAKKKNSLKEQRAMAYMDRSDAKQAVDRRRQNVHNRVKHQ